MDIDAIRQALMFPTRLWSRAEILVRPCPVPKSAGVYAWYFRAIPSGVPISGCHSVDGLTLLYVGIAPSYEGSSGTLYSRIVRSHFCGNASGSTLRLTIGCLLSEQLRLTLRPTGTTARLTFGEGEEILSRWLAENAAVVWHGVEMPWQAESQLIEALLPPLNLDENESHPFYKSLCCIRASHRQAARRIASTED